MSSCRATPFTSAPGRDLLAALLLGAVFLTTLPALARGAGKVSKEDLWVHVAVEEPDGEEIRIRINFPLRYAEKLLPLMNNGKVHQGRVRIDIDDSDMGADDLLAAWRAVKEAREGQFVPIDPPDRRSRDEQVEAARVGETLVIRARDEDSRAQIRLPMRVAEMLVEAAADTDRDDTAELDLAAIVRDMREIGPGEIVTATDGDSLVRIWIDDDEESE